MDYLRRFLQGVKVAPSDEELGRRASIYPNEPQPNGLHPNEPRQSMQNNGEEVVPNTVLETSEKLMEFRMLTGITTHPSFKAPRGFGRDIRPIITTSGRPAPNKGLYATVVDNEVKSKKNFKILSRVINLALILQIIVAAALTALGASNSSHEAVTVFGAINTVIAGFLTFLKGSGLPNRLKFFQHEWAKIRDYIEERERDLASPHNDLDIHEQVDIIRKMYEEVKADMDANTPDRFVSSGALRRTVPPDPALAIRHQSGRSDSGLFQKSKAFITEKEADIFGGSVSSENGLNHPLDEIKKMRSKAEEKMREVAHLEREMEAQRRKAMQLGGDAEKEVEALRRRAVQAGGEVEGEIEAQRKRAAQVGSETEREIEAQRRRAVQGGVDAQSEIETQRRRAAQLGSEAERLVSEGMHPHISFPGSSREEKI